MNDEGDITPNLPLAHATGRIYWGRTEDDF